MTSNIGWELYRTFLGVLREGSLSGAARALGITQPTAGRHVAALEDALGTVLFTRSQTGLLPTEVALALRTHAEAMESTAASLERAASSQGEGVRGVVRVSASEVVCAEVLPPIVARLRETHPALKVELVSTNRVQDLLRREADIAVRMVRPRQEQLVARRIVPWQIPAALLGTLALLAALFNQIDPAHYPPPLLHLLGGSAVMCAFFIATDPVGAPVTPLGRAIFGAGIGALIYVIRTWGGYPEGVAFAVLLMNAATPLIDRLVRPRRYGRLRTGNPIPLAPKEDGR